MKNKCEENENKIIFGDFNITMDKMDRDGGNKTQRLQDIIPKAQDIIPMTMPNGLKMPKLIT